MIDTRSISISAKPLSSSTKDQAHSSSTKHKRTHGTVAAATRGGSTSEAYRRFASICSRYGPFQLLHTPTAGVLSSSEQAAVKALIGVSISDARFNEAFLYSLTHPRCKDFPATSRKIHNQENPTTYMTKMQHIISKRRVFSGRAQASRMHSIPCVQNTATAVERGNERTSGFEALSHGAVVFFLGPESVPKTLEMLHEKKR